MPFRRCGSGGRGAAVLRSSKPIERPCERGSGHEPEREIMVTFRPLRGMGRGSQGWISTSGFWLGVRCPDGQASRQSPQRAGRPRPGGGAVSKSVSKGARLGRADPFHQARSRPCCARGGTSCRSVVVGRCSENAQRFPARGYRAGLLSAQGWLLPAPVPKIRIPWRSGSGSLLRSRVANAAMSENATLQSPAPLRCKSAYATW